MLRTHGSEQLQRKGRAELALIDPVDEDLNVNAHALALQAVMVTVAGFFPIPPNNTPTRAVSRRSAGRCVQPLA